jgi:hypothetical protein
LMDQLQQTVVWRSLCRTIGLQPHSPAHLMRQRGCWSTVVLISSKTSR